ncbi:MAG TPA: OmpA family protein [Bacillota bacterium]
MRIKWLTVFLIAAIMLFSLCFAAAATPIPVISSVSPAQGLNNQQIRLTITGEKFYSPKTSVRLTKAGESDIIATDVVVTKTSITCNVDLQGKAVGAWDVIVTNIGKITKKQKFSALVGGFTIVSSMPTIKSFSPISALNNESVTITVMGTNFRPGAAVSLVKDGNTIAAVKNVVAANSERIDADFVFDGTTPGVYDLQVTNSDGSKAVLNSAFGLIEAVEPEAEVVVEKTPQPEVPVKVDPNSLFKSIFFDFDRYDIRQDQVAALKENLAIVKDNPEGYIILGGHADERGPNNYNLRLSARRAETVKNYLIQNGVSANRIITYAYGETSPLKLGHNEESWQYNRRVDIAIWKEIPTKEDALKK